MRSARGWAVAGLMAAMTAGAAAPAEASVEPCPQQGQEALSTTSVSYEFQNIAEAVLVVSVPAERVRGLVPSRYELIEPSPGRALLVAAHGQVAKLSVGCSDGAEATVSEYGIMIKSPDSDPVERDLRHAYYVSMLTDHRGLITRLGMLGAPIKFAEGEFVVQPDPSGVRIAAKETWERGAVELNATATEPGSNSVGPVPGVRFWFDGPRGTIRTAYMCPDCRPRTPATGSVFGSGGSAVRSILGGARANGGGFFIRATLTATAELNYLED